MHSMKSALLPCLFSLLAKAATFTPESDGYLAYGANTLPIGYNLTKGISKSANATASSLWSSSFVHASDGHDYMVLSHTIAGFPDSSTISDLHRGSIIDITNVTRYGQFTSFSAPSQRYADNGDSSITFSDFGYGYTGTRNGNTLLRTWSSAPGVEYDISFELSAPVLLNGGLGTLGFEGSPTREWSMPAGKTTGWLSFEGKNVTIDTKRSITWYDQQWSGAPNNWTWFELHMSDGASKGAFTPMSIWTYETLTGLAGIATIREASGVQKIIPLASLKSSDRTWTSRVSNKTYDLDWDLRLSDGTTFKISSVRPDQELCDSDGLYPTYEGYVTVKATYKGGKVAQGYGLVEILPA